MPSGPCTSSTGRSSMRTRQRRTLLQAAIRRCMDEGSTPEGNIFHRRRAEEEGEIAESVALRGGHRQRRQALISDAGQESWLHDCRHRYSGSRDRSEYGCFHFVRRCHIASAPGCRSPSDRGCLQWVQRGVVWRRIFFPRISPDPTSKPSVLRTGCLCWVHGPSERRMVSRKD